MAVTGPLLLAFIVFVILFVVGELLYRLASAIWKLYASGFPFAKGNQPFVGHLGIIQSGRCPFDFGTLGLGRTHAALRGTQPCLITSDPAVVTDVCTRLSGYFHARMIDPLAPDAIHSPHVHIFVAHGKRWKRIRTLTSFALSGNQLRSLLPTIIEQSDEFFTYLDDQLNTSEHITIDVHPMFQKLTASVIGRCAFGLERHAFTSPPQHYSLFKQVFGDEPQVAVNLDTLQWILPWTTRLLEHISGFWNAPISKSPIDLLNDEIRSHLESQSLITTPPEGSTNFLQQFKSFELDGAFLGQQSKPQGFEDMNKVKVPRHMDPNEIVAQTRFLSIAGFDTTANTLSLVFLLLAKHRDKLERLHEEADSLPEDVDYNMISGAEYAQAVILETLRLFPHASMLQSRRCMEDCKLLDGRSVKKGVGILFDTWRMHRDPEFWGDDAEEFVPERHLPLGPFPPYFTPFGAGPRHCVGMRFALMEQKAVLLRMLRRFTVRLPLTYDCKRLDLALRNTGTVWPRELQLELARR